jgi:large subunit ribosomal protein L10e
MAHLRPGRCYRKLAKHAYTRTAKRVVKKAFIRGVPANKVTHFDTGKPLGEYNYQVLLLSKDNVQIRHNAIEACRIAILHNISLGIPNEAFHFQVRIYPHHVIREHLMISGAGADRLTTGMAASYGKPGGRAARVRSGQVLYSAKVKDEKEVEIAKKAFARVFSKLPTRCTIEVKKLDAKPKSAN